MPLAPGPLRSMRCGKSSASPLSRQDPLVPGRVFDERDDVEAATAEVVGDRGDAGLVVRVEQVERGDPEGRGAGCDGRERGRGGEGPRQREPTEADRRRRERHRDASAGERDQPDRDHRERQVRGQRLDHGDGPRARPVRRLGEHDEAGAAHRAPADQFDEPLPARTHRSRVRSPPYNRRSRISCLRRRSPIGRGTAFRSPSVRVRVSPSARLHGNPGEADLGDLDVGLLEADPHRHHRVRLRRPLRGERGDLRFQFRLECGDVPVEA